MNADVKERLDEILLEICKLQTKEPHIIFDHFFDHVDTGEHKFTNQMKEDISLKLYHSLTNFYVGVPPYVDKMVKTVDDLNELYKSYTSHFTVNCRKCEEFIDLQPSKENNRILEMIKGEDDKYAKCFDFGTRKYTFKPTSNTFIIANDIRNFIKSDNHFNYYSLNSYKETEKLTNAFINDNIVLGYVGNTTAQVYNENGIIHVLSDDIGEYWYDENAPEEDESSKKSFYEWLDEYGSHEFYDQILKTGLSNSSTIGTVCCGLWWIMGVSKNKIDYDKLVSSGNDFVEIDVEENKEYIFELEFKNREDDYVLHHYKIYKKE